MLLITSLELVCKTSILITSLPEEPIVHYNYTLSYHLTIDFSFWWDSLKISTKTSAIVHLVPRSTEFINTIVMMVRFADYGTFSVVDNSAFIVPS